MDHHTNNYSSSLNVEDLLILDGIVDELQNKNKNLINFFTKEKIKQMLDYIIKEPKDEEDHNKGYKFPFVCSKLFNAISIKSLGIIDLVLSSRKYNLKFIYYI